MTADGSTLAQARRLLAEFAARDDSAGRVRRAIETDRLLSRQETVDFRKLPETYAPALAVLLDLDTLRPDGGLRFLHLGASHGVFCRFLQDLPGVAMAVALDLSLAALLRGRSWGLRHAVLADAVTLAACRRRSLDIVLAESLYVPGYWRPAAIANSIARVARILRAGGCLLVQEWGFDVARVFAPELEDAGLCEVCRVTLAAPTQQGEREVTCFAFGCSDRPQRPTQHPVSAPLSPP